MSAELEQQLKDAFDRLPKPARETSARARSAALAALGTTDRRFSRGLILALVAIAFAVGAGAAALAATGNLRVGIGARQKQVRPVPTRLSVPPGSHGIALVAGGKLWLATRSGLRIEGMPVSAAELSPRALYAVVGIGSSLVAVAPGNRHPWVRPVGGRVVAASWSPDGLKIAYVVARRGGYELRMIEADGSPDRLVVGGVSPAKPSWRPDSLAVAYVDAGGRAAVYDLGTGGLRTFDTRKCGGVTRAVAYAPRGRRLAVAGRSGLALVERWDVRPGCVGLGSAETINAVGWLSPRTVLTTDTPLRRLGAASVLRFYRVGLGTLEPLEGAGFSSAALHAVAVSPAGTRLVVAQASGRRMLELSIDPSPAELVQNGRLRLGPGLFRVRAPAAQVAVSWR
jgi:dipeptidyl aminopeptidase/acylaminoacyl peptidase